MRAPISAIIRAKNKPSPERGAADELGGTMNRRIGTLRSRRPAHCSPPATTPHRPHASRPPRSTARAPLRRPRSPATPGVAPRFEVDPFWPKPLPNHWLLGSTIGVSVDSRDHVWIIHRQQSLNVETEASAGKNTPTGTCCMAAPPVIEFDAAGNVVELVGRPRPKATTGRRRTTASPSITWTTSGSAATTSKTRTC